MLLRPEGAGVLCIGQASHAWISGQLARAWRDVAPREEVALAAEQHDVGWSEADRAPQLDAESGLPRDFMAIDLDARLAIWDPAPRRLESQSLYAALLVSLHGTSLHERVPGAQGYLAGQRALQEDWRARLGVDPGELERNRRLLAAWDALSLALCLRWDPYETEGLRLERLDGERFALSPWPLREAAPLEVHCEGRLLEGRFADEPALHDALARAPLRRLRFTLVP